MTLHVVLCLTMCFVAARHRDVIGYLRFCGVFFVLSLLVGGGINAMMNLLGTANSNIKNLLFCGVVLFIILYAVWQISGGWIKKRLLSKVIQIEIYHQGERAVFSGLVDSGNLLREPMTGYPVILVKPRPLEGILSGEMMEVLKVGLSEGSVGILAVPMSCGGNNRLIFGFIPDALFISGGKNGRSEAKAVIAMDNLGESYAGCQCLVPLAL